MNRHPTPVTLTSHDGLTLAGESSGVGDDVLLVHANGFHKEVWRPVTERLRAVHAVAVDQRGHGGSGVGPPPFDWWDLGADARRWAETLGRPRIGVGHSSGGAAVAMAEIVTPGTWDALVLIEPITFPGPFARQDDHALVASALRRRASFADRTETRNAYAGRGPFRLWTAEALDLYVEHAFHDGPDGRRHLVCRPETEAEFYREGNAHGTWDRLPEIGCPVTIVIGARSDTHPADFAAALCDRFRSGTLVTVADASHFVPMERPDAVAAVVQSLVG